VTTVSRWRKAWSWISKRTLVSWFQLIVGGRDVWALRLFGDGEKVSLSSHEPVFIYGVSLSWKADISKEVTRGNRGQATRRTAPLACQSCDALQRSLRHSRGGSVTRAEVVKSEATGPEKTRLAARSSHAHVSARHSSLAWPGF
jgi:hypothetical protein